MKHLSNFIVQKIFFLKIVEESAIKYTIRVQNLCTVYLIIKSDSCIYYSCSQTVIRVFIACAKLFSGLIKMHDN